MKRVLLYILILFQSINTNAQNQISGNIKDIKNGQPLSLVSIHIPDLKIGTVSNSFGEYQLKNIPTGNYLVEISLIGYRSIEVKINIRGVSTFNFSLTPQSFVLNEVVLTGVAKAAKKSETPIRVEFLIF